MIEVCKSRDRRAGLRRGLLGSVSTLAMVGVSLVIAQPASAAPLDTMTATSVPGQRELVVTVAPLDADDAVSTEYDHVTVSAVSGTSTIDTCVIVPADNPLSCTLEPLVAGTSYKVVAKALETGDETSVLETATILSTAGDTTTPTLSPPADASVIATATGASGAVKVEWTADENLGGSVVDHYTANAYLGGSASQGSCETDDAETDNCTITGLVNGAEYSFEVIANNANPLGDSPATDPSGIATALATPGVGAGVVTGVVATVDEASGDAMVSWTAPADADEDTGYVAAIERVDAQALVAEACVATAMLPAEMTFTTCSGLASGVDYRIAVTSLKNGVSSDEATADVTAKSYAPPVPVDPAVDGGDEQATVSWTAPDDSGVTVEGYRVIAAETAAPTVAVATCVTTGLTCTVTGLTNGTEYDTTVLSYGTTGTQSAAVATDPTSVTPAVVPKPEPPVVTEPEPGDVTATSATINWTAADEVAGAAVLYYTATAEATSAGDAGSPDASNPSCTVAAPATACEISGLEPNTEYTVTVVAYASATVYSTAGSLTITTVAGEGPPGPGGPGAMNGPVVTNRDGLSQMFARGGDNNLYTNVRDANGDWGQWTSLGGLIGSEPVAVVNAPGPEARLQVFVLGFADHAVWFKLQTADGTGWGPWTQVDGSKYISKIETQNNQNGTVQVFGRGADGNLYYAVQKTATDPAVWQGWVSLGGLIASDPHVVQWEDGTLDVFAIGAGDGQIWHTVQATAGDNTSWVWWKHVAPSVAKQLSL